MRNKRPAQRNDCSSHPVGEGRRGEPAAARDGEAGRPWRGPRDEPRPTGRVGRRGASVTRAPSPRAAVASPRRRPRGGRRRPHRGLVRRRRGAGLAPAESAASQLLTRAADAARRAPAKMALVLFI